MKTPTALWVAIAMISVALAGCTGGGELDMLVTPADDPVNEPFLFEATGPSYDHYEWDFNDGTPNVEGKEVEHVFGFGNGDIVVRLTAHNEGDEANAVTIARTVDLGGGPNTNPEGVLVANKEWVNPGEPFTLSAAGSTDPDGDPLLYRWSIERVRELIPPDTSHPPHEGYGALPFGVDAWATVDPGLELSGTDYGSALPVELDAAAARPWSSTESAIQGSIPESGAYTIEVFVKDPKGSPWVGRLNMYVAEPDRLKPEPTYGFDFTGTLQGGIQGGQFQALYHGENQPEDVPVTLFSVVGQDESFDRIEYEFTVDIPSLGGTIDFGYSGGSVDGGTTAQYRIYDSRSGQEAVAARSDGMSLSKDTLRTNPNGSPRDYILEITLQPAGTQVEVEFSLDAQSDLDPLNWYERL